MDDAALAYPVIAWILMKGRGEYSIRENSHAGGVEGGKRRNGPGHLHEGKHHFVHGGELFCRLFGLNHLRELTPRRYGCNCHLVNRRRKWRRSRCASGNAATGDISGWLASPCATWANSGAGSSE